MSIDKQVFVELVGELETYYKREFTPFVKRVWYKHLSDCLTTVEFQSAVELNGCPRIYADAAATRRSDQGRPRSASS